MTTEEKLQEKIADLEATKNKAMFLIQMSRGLNTATDKDELLYTLARPGIDAGVAGAELWYIEMDKEGRPAWMRKVADWRRGDAAPSTPIGTRYHLPDYPFSSMLLAMPDEPLLIVDAEQDERLDEKSKAVVRRSGGGSLAIIPLNQGGRWVGWLALRWKETHTFGQHEKDVYQAMIGLASPAVENRRVLDDLEQIVEERTEEVAIFRLLAENSIDAIAMGTMDGKLTYANQACHEIFGYDYESDEMIGRQLTEFWPADETAALANEVMPAAIEEGGWNGEVKQKRRDGSLFNASVAVFPVQENYVAAMIRDVTERKKAEKELIQSRTNLQSLFESLEDFLFILDMNGNILEVNPIVEERLGYSMEELRGESVLKVHPPDRRDEALANVTAMLEGAADLYLVPLMPREGSLIPVETKVFPGSWDDQKVVFGISHDITELKKAEAERERLQQKVIDAQKKALQELSTPIIPVMERIIVMPLIGSIDTLRAKDIMRSLLRGISEHHARVVILDITGVPIVDSGVANHLNKTIQAARLKGTRTIVTGISDAVAETIVDLGIDWSGIETLCDLQTGLMAALDSMGFKLTR